MSFSDGVSTTLPIAVATINFECTVYDYGLWRCVHLALRDLAKTRVVKCYGCSRVVHILR